MNQITKIPSKYHPEWQECRINYLVNKFSKETFRDKTLLELAPFNGYIGNVFFELGADVHGVEGRLENVNNIQSNYPHLKIQHGNLDCPDWSWGDFDIIINMGLLYHLENYHEQHLSNCIKHSRLLVLETVITTLDSDFESVSEKGPDQSLTSVGKRPSVKWIENCFKSNKCRYERITDMPNSGMHRYDGHGAPGYNRAMWIVYRE